MIRAARRAYRLRTSAYARGVFAEVAAWGAGGMAAGLAIIAVHLFT